MKIASFNVRGLSSEIRKKNLILDAINYHCDVISLQETKISELDLQIDGFRLLTLGTGNRHYGLGFVLSPQINKHLYKYWSVSDRIGVIKLIFRKTEDKKGKTTFISIINVYAPTSSLTTKDHSACDNFYQDLQETIENLKGDTILITGDFNSKVGKKYPTENIDCIGSYSKGKRNKNGEALVEFCLNNKFFISNTAFKHKSSHITTWEGQIKDKQNNKIIHIYNQIDFILVPQWLKTNLLNSRSYAGTLTSSDHRLLITTLTGIKRIIPKPLKRPETQCINKYDTRSLLNEDTKKSYQDACRVNILNSEPFTLQERLENIEKALKTAASKTLNEIEPQSTKTDCPIIRSLSLKQKQLRLQIQSAKTQEVVKRKRADRNKILHEIRKISLKNANERIDGVIATLEACSFSHVTFKAVDLIRKKPGTNKLSIKDTNGHFVDNDKEKLNILHSFFKEKYNDPNNVNPFSSTSPQQLQNPISSAEIKSAITRLNYNRAPGPDNIPAEYLKFAPDEIIDQLEYIFNSIFEKNQLIDVSNGKLILLQKPGKPIGPLTSLRPIVLLNTVRKTLSIITYNRIKDDVNKYLSPSQAGFRPLRSTADIVWAHRWMVSRVEKYREQYTILGIDMSSAFDTIDRGKLLNVCGTFLKDDEIRLIRLLLANTSLTISLRGHTSKFNTIKGTPQGDNLSPVLFIVYLEAALRDLRPKILPLDTTAPNELVYADDVDFIFKTKNEAEQALPIISETLKEWNLIVNETKTEMTEVKRKSTSWRKVRKLGSLLDTKEDVKRRKILAINAFNSMYSIWVRHKSISRPKIIRLYNALVLPILTYNCGTWGLTKKESESLDAFHRKQLRKILGIRWDDKVTNEELYNISKCRPLSEFIRKMRLMLFGHVLRRDAQIPAQLAMNQYFEKGDKQYQGRKPTNIHTVINQDLSITTPTFMKDHTYCIRNEGTKLLTTNDLKKLREIAYDRDSWKTLIEAILDTSSQA